VIVRARNVVTMDGAPIQNGAVRVHRDRIVEVGKFSELARLSEAVEIKETMVDLDDSVLLPGLINAHCHLDYTGLRGRISRQSSFADWIRLINAEKAKLTRNDYLRSIVEGFVEAQRFGTTSIVNLEAFPELITQLPPPSLRTWWCAEFIDVSAPEKFNEIVSEAFRNLTSIANDRAGFGLAPHSPFTASAELYRACERIAERDAFLLTTHLAESREEMEMFSERSGPLFEFLKSFGRSMDDCGATTPLAAFLGKVDEARSETSSRAIGVNRPYHRWLIAHLNEIAERDFDLLAKLPQMLSVAHCPRSHAYFGHSPFAFERLEALGVNICLGTDSLASNTDLSLFAEMREFRRLHTSIPAEKILAMITVNPAKAIGAEDSLGKVRAGYQADMIAIPTTSKASSAYDSIIGFTGDVSWMMIGGETA
jgi:cytosine/adenosine deaminase-related metal-dependent hydrolase